MKTIVILSDIQAPLHDHKAVAAVQQFVADFQPDVLACVGDEADNTEISRWVKGTKEEFAGTLQRSLDATASVMRGFREAAGDVPFIVQRSNHGDRIQNYITRYAPGFEGLRALDPSNLLAYNELDITVSDKPTDIAPGWVMMHGDEAGMNRTAGGTALGLARKVGKSVVCGHTHQLGFQHDHDSVNGKITRHLYGMEVGHLMDLRKAGYLKYGGANWQAGFGLMYVEGNKTIATPVPIVNKAFVVEGQRYEL